MSFKHVSIASHEINIKQIHVIQDNIQTLYTLVNIIRNHWRMTTLSLRLDETLNIRSTRRHHSSSDDDENDDDDDDDDESDDNDDNDDDENDDDDDENDDESNQSQNNDVNESNESERENDEKEEKSEKNDEDKNDEDDDDENNDDEDDENENEKTSAFASTISQSFVDVSSFSSEFVFELRRNSRLTCVDVTSIKREKDRAINNENELRTTSSKRRRVSDV